MRISNRILYVASVCVFPVLLLQSTSALARHASARDIPGDPAARWKTASRSDAPVCPASEDCIQFGNYQIINGGYYAVEGGIWDFEDGAQGPGQGGPSLQGWYSVDMTANPGAWWRHITDDIWSGDPWNPASVPLINGPGCVWIGRFAGEARDLCWPSTSAGYGNNWCQRLTSPAFTYTGSGDVVLSFMYWNDTEPGYDFSKVILQVGFGMTTLNAPGFTGRIGFDAGGVPGGEHAATYDRVVTNAELGGGDQARTFHIILEFVSDGGWSDEDGSFVTEYGPWAVDDFLLAGSVASPGSFDFDDGIQGWAPSACPSIGSYLSVQTLDNYIIQDPAGCGLEGHIVAFHNPESMHFAGQRETAWSPIVDRTSVPDYQDYSRIACTWDQYNEAAMDGSVWYRPSWRYYPYHCSHTGEDVWSPRVGTHTFFYTGTAPTCYAGGNVGTDWGLPPDCTMLRFGMEIWATCEPFGLSCSSFDNFSPLFDNFRVLMCRAENSAVPEAEMAGNHPARLHQNKPNPFTEHTTIRFSLARAGATRLTIHDVAGRRVRTLVDGHRDAGCHSSIWDGLDDEGRMAASGVFWSQLSVDGSVHRHRMVILK